MITKRRICWPNPDATCLEGGCSYCNDYPYRGTSVIRRYAENAGVLPHRSKGEGLAIDALNWGFRNDFVRADIVKQ